MGSPRHEASPGLRRLYCGADVGGCWALTPPGVALPNRPLLLRHPTLGPGLWGVMTTTTCQNQKHTVPSLRSSTGALPPRPDILYPDGQACNLHHTHTHREIVSSFTAPPHVALISASLDRGISAARSVSFVSHKHSQPLNILPRIPSHPIHKTKSLGYRTAYAYVGGLTYPLHV